jgi:D-psicose/D-tagatose/L-ribulose 3-epimerase
VGDWSKDEAVKAISGTKKAGYDLIELNVSVPEAVDAQMTKSVLKDHDLGASASLGLSVETDISNPDPAIHNAGIELLTKSMQVLADVGGKSFVGVNYCAMNKYKGPKTKEQWDTVVKNLKELSNRANDLGLEYGLEVVNRYETNIANTAYQAMELVDAVGAPNIGVHLDTYHMNIEENNFEKAIALCGDKLQYFHVGESHRGYLGTGSVDWSRMWGGLAAADFKGPITFESFSSAVVSPSLSNTLCVWRDLWDDSEDLAVKAREFIGAGLYSAYRTHKF